MLKKILIAVASILSVMVLYAAFKPSHYLIKREIVIQAKPEVIYPYLASMQKTETWMPWKESDPNAVSTYSGPQEGIGSTSSWTSTGSMGTGKAEIVGVVTNQSVNTKITYIKPMEMTQDSEFLLSPSNDGTRMTWTVTGEQPFFPRLICTLLFMNMDKYVGGMFEKGLANLKTIAEAPSATK